MSKLKLLIIGNLAYDIILTGDGTKVVQGGSAFYCAVGAAKFSRNVAIVSRVGSDYSLQELERRKIDINGIKIMINRSSDKFYCLSTKSNKDKKDLEDKVDAGKRINFKDIPNEFLDAEFIHLATMDPHKQFKILEYLRGVSHAKISADTCLEFIKTKRKWTKRVMENVDLVFLNEIEYESLGNLEYKDLVIKRGANGAMAWISGQSYSVNAPRTKVKDTTGCGDLLAGAFLALVAEGSDIRRSLSESVKLASQKTKNFGIESIENE